MGSKDFLLFFQDVCHFFLESEVLFSTIVVFQGRFHDIYVFSQLFLIDLVHLGMNLFLKLVINTFLILLFTIQSVTLLVVSLLLLWFIYQRQTWLFRSRIRSDPWLSFLFYRISFYFFLWLFFFLSVDSWVIWERRTFLIRNCTFVLGFLFD